GGGGVTCVMENGAVFEKAGVNVSAIHGTLGPAALKEMRARHKEIELDKEYAFFACGISSVIHPHEKSAYNCLFFNVWSLSSDVVAEANR
ncbi:unnamed protein product, partial [Dicrocoelium dendriticum]